MSLEILRYAIVYLCCGLLAASEQQLRCDESKGPEYNISYGGGLVRVTVLPISILLPDSRKLNACPCYHLPYNDHCISIKENHESCRYSVTCLFTANINRIFAQGYEERLLLRIPSHAEALYRQGRRRRESEDNVSVIFDSDFV